VCRYLFVGATRTDDDKNTGYIRLSLCIAFAWMPGGGGALMSDER
jgi:hypothetical protein